MDIKTFRESEMSGQLAALLREPVLVTAMQVASDSSPVNNMGNISQVEHVAHIQHGISKGYGFYPSVLKLMATPPTGGDEVERTYAPSEEEKE